MPQKIIINILILVSLILFYSCSAQTTYDILSIFFDDVPLPDSTLINKNRLVFSEIDTAGKSSKQDLPEIIHPPAEEGSCNNCHDLNNSFILTDFPPKLCYGCHDDFSKKYKLLHGPLNTGACTICHDPHKSVYQPLILTPGQELCFICHEKNDILRNDVHSSIDDTKCWDCHNPHGGNESSFMK